MRLRRSAQPVRQPLQDSCHLIGTAGIGESHVAVAGKRVEVATRGGRDMRLGQHVVQIKLEINIFGPQRELFVTEVDANWPAVRAEQMLTDLLGVLHVAEREAAHIDAGRNGRGGWCARTC